MCQAGPLGQKDESHTTPSSREPAIQWETQKRGHCQLARMEQRRDSVPGSTEMAAGQVLKAKLEAGSRGKEPKDGWLRLGEDRVL